MLKSLIKIKHAGLNGKWGTILMYLMGHGLLLINHEPITQMGTINYVHGQWPRVQYYRRFIRLQISLGKRYRGNRGKLSIFPDRIIIKSKPEQQIQRFQSQSVNRHIQSRRYKLELIVIMLRFSKKQKALTMSNQDIIGPTVNKPSSIQPCLDLAISKYSSDGLDIT